MKRSHLRTFICALCFVFVSITAKAIPDTIAVYGPDTVCMGTDHWYVPDTNAPLLGSGWWQINANGNLITNSFFFQHVYWGSVGNGLLIYRESNPGGQLVHVGIKHVYILPLPQPVITTNFKVECQKLGTTDTSLYSGFDTSKCLKVCANNCITYYAIGSPGSTYKWTALGGTVTYEDADSCIVCWGPTGTGTITVEETTEHGCIGKTTYCIEIIESPAAHFVTMPDTTLRFVRICDSTEVIFLDKSTSPSSSPIVSWHWDFGDGQYSNAKGSLSAPVTHMYTGPGNTYTAILTVTNKCGCATRDTITITVDPTTRLKIECPRVVCEGDTAVYSVSTACTSGSWSVMGGTILASSSNSVLVHWNPADPSGMGYVMFDATACGIPCSYSTVKVPVVLKTGNIEGPTILCPNGNYIFRLPQWPTTRYSWSLNGGAMAYVTPTDQPNEIVINTSTAETITLTCNYSNTLLGCGGQATLTIDVLDPVTLAGPEKVCFNTNGTYSLTGSNAFTGSWKLTYPDANFKTGSGAGFTELFDQVGTYILEVTGSFCPPAPMLITVDSLPPLPDMISGPDSFCRGIPVHFLGKEEVNGTIFNWAMSNGKVNAASGSSTYATMNPASSGPFIIYLWRETTAPPHCHSDTITKQVYLPTINHTITGNDTPCLNTQYTYQSTYDAGEYYEWRIYPEDAGSVRTGDGNKSVSILWNNAAMTAKVVCRMRKCFIDYYDTLIVTLGTVPVVYSGPSTVCGGDSFTVSVTNASASFDFDDSKGSFASGSGSYRYAYSGNLNKVCTLTINVTDVCGNKFVYTPKPQITVNPTPIGLVPAAVYGCDSINDSIHYTQITGGLATVTGYQWYYNGSVTPIATTVGYRIKQFGYYILKVTASNGCIWTSDTIWAIDYCVCTFNGGTPVVSITSDTVTDCNHIHLTASYSLPGFQYATWECARPNVAFGPTSYTDADADVFDEPGYYTIKYTATYLDDSGHTCKFYAYRTVKVIYVAKLWYYFTCDDSASMRKVVLTPGVTVFPPIVTNDFYVDGVLVQSGTQYSWSGYLSQGSHTAKLRSSYAPGHVCETSVINFNVDWLNAGFNFDRPQTCQKEASVDFTNTTTGMGGIFTSLWRFGDGAENTQKNPARVYDIPGIKNVTLIVTDEYGCSDSETRSVTIVRDSLKGSLTTLPHHPCPSAGITFTYIPSPGFPKYPTKYSWYRDQGVAGFTTYQPWVIGAETGMWWLHGEDDYGCVANTNADTTEAVQVPKPYISGKPHACVGEDFTLNGYAGSDPNINYQWLRNGSGIGTNNALLTENISSPGVYSYRLVITVSLQGVSCDDTSQPFTVTVHATPAPPSPAYTILDCNSYQIELTASHTSGATQTFNWNNGLTGTPVYTYEGGPYQLTFIDSFGCKSYAELYVPKSPAEYLWIFPTGCWSICPPKAYVIVGPIIPFSQWDYLKNGGSVWGGTNTIPASYPNLSFDAPGTFNLYLDNGYCSATSGDMIVDVNCNPFTWQGKPGNTLSAEQLERMLKPGLDIMPNPAGNSTKIVYTFASTKAEKRVEVYDMTGRLVSHAIVQQVQGSVQLSLERYQPGVYQVILRQDGQAIVNRKMTVVK